MHTIDYNVFGSNVVRQNGQHGADSNERKIIDKICNSIRFPAQTHTHKYTVAVCVRLTIFKEHRRSFASLLILDHSKSHKNCMVKAIDSSTIRIVFCSSMQTRMDKAEPTNANNVLRYMENVCTHIFTGVLDIQRAAGNHQKKIKNVQTLFLIAFLHVCT